MQAESTTPSPRARRRKTKIALAVVVAVIAIVAVAIVTVGAFAVSERGLVYIAARISDRSGGELRIDSPSGSIANTMRFARITLRTDDASLVLDNVVLDWNPWTLLHKRVAIRRLSARRLDLMT